jgi:hypothetical protein
MIFVSLGFVDNDLQVKGLKRPLDKQSLCKLDFNLLKESKAMSSIDPVLFLASIQEGFSDRKRRLWIDKPMLSNIPEPLSYSRTSPNLTWFFPTLAHM